jgi:hypothetical protein
MGDTRSVVRKGVSLGTIKSPGLRSIANQDGDVRVAANLDYPKQKEKQDWQHERQFDQSLPRLLPCRCSLHSYSTKMGLVSHAGVRPPGEVPSVTVGLPVVATE